MNWKALFALESLVILQGIAAYRDGFLTQRQLRARGVMNGYSFMEHGGMWMDFCVLSPLMAYLLENYRPAYGSMLSYCIIAALVPIALGLGRMYAKGAVLRPEAHSHGGTTTVAGWIHGIYALPVAWMIVMVYCGAMSPLVSKSDLIICSVALTPFFFFGAAKFNKNWTFDRMAKTQTFGGAAAIWIAAGIRLHLQK